MQKLLEDYREKCGVWEGDVQEELEFLLGRTKTTKKLQTLRLPQDQPNVLMMSEGVSVHMKNVNLLLQSLAQSYSPRDLGIMVLDFNRCEFSIYTKAEKSLPHIIPTEDMRDAATVALELAELNEFMDVRIQKKLASKVVVIVNGYDTLLQDDTLRKFNKNLLTLCDKASEANMHFIFTISSIDLKIEKDLRSHVYCVVETKGEYTVDERVDIHFKGDSRVIERGDMRFTYLDIIKNIEYLHNKPVEVSKCS